MIKVDLTGQKFNKLTVLGFDHRGSDYKAYWLCQCECGNTCVVEGYHLKTGHTKSCGCHRRADLTNKRFGRLVALKYAYTKNKKVYWHCKCDCGNEIDVQANSLLTGNTTSCGCAKKGCNIIDLTNQVFGKLTVLEYSHSDGNNAFWKCQCQCGNEIIVSSNALRRKHTQSCGCLKSRGELLISEILNKYNISFQKEYSFPDLKAINRLRFDFAIMQNNILKLIEFDGEQHYTTKEEWWNTQEYVNLLKEHDNQKNEYCIQHNIPLLRLNYKQSKEEIEEEIKKFLDIK